MKYQTKNPYLPVGFRALVFGIHYTIRKNSNNDAACVESESYYYLYFVDIFFFF